MKKSAFIKIPSIPDEANIDINNVKEVFEFFGIKPRSFFLFLCQGNVHKTSTRYNDGIEILEIVKESFYFDGTNKDSIELDQNIIEDEIYKQVHNEVKSIEKRLSEESRMDDKNKIDRRLFLEAIAASNGKTLKD